MPPPVTTPVIHPYSNGDVFLSATNAALHGSQLQLETQGGLPDISYWDMAMSGVDARRKCPRPARSVSAPRLPRLMLKRGLLSKWAVKSSAPRSYDRRW